MLWLDEVKWDRDGLVPAIAQEAATGDVLMFAYMNRDALQATAERGEAVYWSRSRQRLWHKGEESGHVQTVHEIRLDCDGDVILLRVTQHGHEPGIACHTGRHSCFFRTLLAIEGPQTCRPAGVRPPEGDEKTWDGPAFSHEWISVDPVLKDPESIYR